MSAVLKEEDFVEARIARLESDVAHIRTDVSEAKTDIRELNNGVGVLKEKAVELSGDIKKLDVKVDKTAAELRTEIAKASNSVRNWVIGLIFLVLGAMAHGFKWL